jgi:hypothetical protein
MKKTDSPTAYYTNSEPKCVTAMILRSSVTLVDKINNAKPDAHLFPDGQGIFNRQFSSLIQFFIGIKLNSLEKTPNTIAYHKSEIGLDNCPWHKNQH